jgi:hypothetical protein
MKGEATGRTSNEFSTSNGNGAAPVPPKLGYFDSLPPLAQFFILSFLTFLFFGAHNVLQEAMVALPGFDFAMMLGYMEVIG